MFSCEQGALSTTLQMDRPLMRAVEREQGAERWISKQQERRINRERTNE